MDLETLHTYEPFLLGFVIIAAILFFVRCCLESRCWACDRDIQKEGNKHVLNGVEYECFNGSGYERDNE